MNRIQLKIDIKQNLHIFMHVQIYIQVCERVSVKIRIQIYINNSIITMMNSKVCDDTSNPVEDKCIEQMMQMNPQIDKLISHRLYNNILHDVCNQLHVTMEGSQQMGSVQEMDSNDVILYLMQHYNQAQELHARKLAHLESTYARKYEQLEEQYRTGMRKMELKYKQELKQCKQEIEKQQKIIADMSSKAEQSMASRDARIQQFGNKISMLQAMIEKYEYQTQSMAMEQTARMQEMGAAVAQSQCISAVALANASRMQMQLQQDTHQNIERWQSYLQSMSQQAQVATMMSQLYTRMHSSHDNTLSLQSAPVCIQEQLCTVQQIWLSQWQQYTKLLTQLKQQNNTLLSYINKLLTHCKQQHYSYDNLNHKYAQFLKQTQGKINNQKNRISALEEQVGALQATNQQYVGAVQQGKKQIARLLELLKHNIDREKHIGEQHSTTLGQLRAELSEKSKQCEQKARQCEQMENSRKEEQAKFEKHINMLTIEVQSLKQSICTLKNVIRVHKDKDQQQQPIDTTIVQQMIDKTYQIRLQNTQLKDIIAQLKTTNKQLGNNINTMQHTQQNIQQQLNKLQQLNVQYQTKISQYQIELSSLQLLIDGKDKEILEMSGKMEEIVGQNQKLRQKDDRLLCQLEMEKQQIQCLCQEYYVSYQQMEMLRIELFVLNQIIKQRQRHENTQSKQIQVELLKYQQVDESPLTTARNYLNCTASRTNIRQQADSVGKLVNVNANRSVSAKQNHHHCLPSKVSSKQTHNQDQSIDHLNKTCKIRMNSTEHTARNQVEEMNDIINYMINYLKGYTRNGVRKMCWLTAQGDDYMFKINNPKNIKQKYGTFERVRSLIQKNQTCKQLIKDFEKISNYYFVNIQTNVIEQSMSVNMWESFDQDNICINTETSHYKPKYLDATHLKTK